MSSATIEEGKVVSIHYELKNGEGEVLDSSAGGDPLEYLHGAENIVPGLEKQLTGKAAGDKVQAEVAPADGYGERDERGVFDVPKTEFPDEVEPEVGMNFAIQDDGGHVFPVWISEVHEEKVVLDVNHPLAGVTLHFDVSIEAIREATEEETTHGHVHGPDDEHHH